MTSLWSGRECGWKHLVSFIDIPYLFQLVNTHCLSYEKKKVLATRQAN